MQKLVMFHYHFLPGGVSDVVRLFFVNLARGGLPWSSVTLVSGRADKAEAFRDSLLREMPPEERKKFSLLILPETDYSRPEAGEDLSAAIREKLRTLEGEDTLWWVHNPHLGKNPFFTKALAAVVEDGTQKTVLQIHDFPECARYDNWLYLRDSGARSLYPLGEKVRYVVINRHDYDLLKESGMPPSLLFLLYNPIRPPRTESAELVNQAKQADQEEKAKGNKDLRERLYGSFGRDFPACRPEAPLLFYPVRTIRRKNILEAGALARLLEANLIVTLPGVSEQEKAYSDRIEEAYRSGLIPGFWGIGQSLEEKGFRFEELWDGADLVCSSSVQEGFGYLFVNAVKQKKPFLARFLFAVEGFSEIFAGYPHHFYRRFTLPIDAKTKQAVIRRYRKRIDLLVRKIPRLSLFYEKAEELFREEPDFSFLPVSVQADCLQKLASDRGYFRECFERNRELLEEGKRLLASPVIPESKAGDDLFLPASFRRKVEGILDSFQYSAEDSGGKKPEGLRVIPGELEEKMLLNNIRMEFLRLLNFFPQEP